MYAGGINLPAEVLGHSLGHTRWRLQGEAMEYAGPIRGGSAGINSASFWICPECSACVMESPATDGWQRQQHTVWHDKNRKSPTLEDLQRAAGEHTQLWANEWLR